MIFNHQQHRIQPKLTIGQPNDKYKQEADASANRLMQMRASQNPPLQRKCADYEEKEEMLMKTITETNEMMVQKQTEPTTTTGNNNEQDQPPQLCNRTLPLAEVDERNTILEDHFARGWSSIDETFRGIIAISMCDFSLNQLQLMSAAGLRFWSDSMESAVPPPFVGLAVRNNDSHGNASYAPNIRTIFLTNPVNPGFLTHEMAHAWDHIRNLRPALKVRLEDVPRLRRERLIGSPGRLLSETDRSHAIQEGDPSIDMTIREMFQNYFDRTQTTPRERAFSHAASVTYSRTDPREFYAEGYAVFHGNSIDQQARLYRYARELYIFLHNEAIAEQMPVPNLREVRVAARGRRRRP